MTDWPIVRIADLGRVVTGRTPPGNDSAYYGERMPFLTQSDMSGRRVGRTGRSLSDRGIQLLERCLVPHGVGVACIGWQMGKSVLIDRPMVTNQQINSILVDESVADPLFVYYSLVLRRDELFNLGAGGSRTPILNKGDFERLPFALPPLPEQRAIARILGSLDDKIELNRRMNETLEGTARALFKSWFVDFDPVRAKAEGRDAGLPSKIADLFPDSFDESELGEIPEGWEVRTIGDGCDVVDCLHSKKPERRAEGRPLLQLSNIGEDGLIDMSDEYLIDEVDFRLWTSRLLASPGDCVITNVGRVGAVGQLPLGVHAALGRNMTAVRCRPSFPFPTFLIECLRSEAMRCEISLRTDTGTILDALNVRSIPRLRFVVDSGNRLAEQFERLTRPFRERMELLKKESFLLAATRDLLLPKLISGELLVPDAEKITEAAV